MTSLEMENTTFASCLDRLFSLWNNAIYHMNYWVHTAGTYRATTILGGVHATFFNYHQFNEICYMPEETVLARIMSALDLEFERTLHYIDKGYESDNEYGLQTQVWRPVMCLFSLDNWGLLYLCKLQGNTMSYLSLHAKAAQGWVVFPSRGLQMPNLWWDIPTRSGLQWWGISSYD